MAWNHTRPALLIAGGCAAIVAGWLTLGGQPRARSAPPARAALVPGALPVSAPPGAARDRAPDEEAVRKAVDAFVAAFRKGDAKAVADSWTAEGEYVGDDGATFRGRAALEKAYADTFAKDKGGALEVEVGTIRFPSKDNAVVEGYFKLHTAKGEHVVSKCSLLLAREDGRWLIAIAREWPGDGLSLRDLEWLIGTWESKRDGVTVTTKYDWTANKSFIRCAFSVAQEGQTLTGSQRIGKMPSTGGLHQWTFEDSGGVGDADITRDGKKWVFASRGSTADGRVVIATNFMTPIDADSFTFQSVERSMDGEPLPDLAPLKVTRVKAKP